MTSPNDTRALAGPDAAATDPAPGVRFLRPGAEISPTRSVELTGDDRATPSTGTGGASGVVRRPTG